MIKITKVEHRTFPNRNRKPPKPRASLTISAEELQAGCLVFEEKEKRDPIYKSASFLVNHFWGQPTEVAEGLGVLLLVWNAAFYGPGLLFSFDALEDCLRQNQEELDDFRKRDILSYTPKDNPRIKSLFLDLLDALQIVTGKTRKGVKSPVGAAKALHLLAPSYFPIWDEKIAKRYGFKYTATNSAEKYVGFLSTTKDQAQHLAPLVSAPKKTLLKLIDEYNYAKYSQEWLEDR